MFFPRFFYIYFLLNLFLYKIHAYEYCKNGLGDELCGGSKHFLCDETQMTNTTTFKYVYPQIKDWTDRMLDWHNTYRDMVASGTVKNKKNETYGSASRMRVLMWDHELAYLSYMHVSRCNATKVTCHKTKKFKKAGQNIGRITLAMNATALNVLEQNIKAWFMEKDKLLSEDMKNIPDTKFASAEHFMILINDEVSKVGCAMSFCTDCDPKNATMKYCYYITCHYNFGALADYRLYKDGAPASDCAYWGTKPSKRYTSLCTNCGRDFSDMECAGDDPLECTRDGIDVDSWSAALADSPPPRSAEYEYCNNGVGDHICKETHYPHFICDDTQVEQVGTCEKIYPMDGEWQKRMLARHNELRNKMASGTENNNKSEIFPAAGRMRVLVWDDELAYLSKMHVRKCNMTHSKCHKVPRFPSTGQNLAYVAAPYPMHNMMKINTENIDYWYDEKNLCVGKELRFYPEPPRALDVGHLTVQINDEVSRVGCAFAHCLNCLPKNEFCYFTTCHYDYTAATGTRLYFVADKPASDCAYWGSVPDSTYPNLCHNPGTMYPTIKCTKEKACYRNWIPVDEWKHP